jgi:rhodanese-related sulfurtransferase
MTLLDVREEWEIQVAAVPSPTVHIPMGQVPVRLAELDTHLDTVVICRSGGRSMEIARFLERRGFASVYNLTGGILAWSRDIDPGIPQY